MQVKIQYRECRSRPQEGPMRRPPNRKHDTSPYSTSPYLSPPSDTGWRRTNSDSALHQSAMQVNYDYTLNSFLAIIILFVCQGGMCGDKRNENSNSRWMLQALNGPEQHENRPRSCEVPRVPGIQ